jgi:tetratricopeptide (TPR) repeat protein
MGRDDDARASYEHVLPLLESEPRCTRLDWERSSVQVNIGNTFSRQGDFDKAQDYYTRAIQLGQDHMDYEGSNKVEGMGIMIVGMRARAFALKKAGKDEEGKAEMKKVIEMQFQLNTEREKQKEKEKDEIEAAQKAAEAGASEQTAEGEKSDNPAELVAES